jgi:hypothetical protein
MPTVTEPNFDIRTLPRLRAGLAVDTLAWATVDQLHPTQAQTGLREVNRKARDFVELLEKRKEGRFPNELYDTLLARNYIVPVYIGKTPEQDSRYGREEVLGFATDRTHTAAALAKAYKKFFGESAYQQPQFSGHNRVINFVLVRVKGDKADLSCDKFGAYMVEHNHCYLEHWTEGANGAAAIKRLKFWALPEKVCETEDNPYRGVIGQLQHLGVLRRSPVEFSQFIAAKVLEQAQVVKWSDIALDVGSNAYAKAVDKAAEFFKGPKVAKLLGNCADMLPSAAPRTP